MLHTLTKRIRHDEELLRTTSQSLIQSSGVMLVSTLVFLAICAAILLVGR